jgi:hypothetical protein
MNAQLPIGGVLAASNPVATTSGMGGSQGKFQSSSKNHPVYYQQPYSTKNQNSANLMNFD